MVRYIYISLLILLISCEESSKFTGYIVCKEYVPEHMSDVCAPDPIAEAGFVYVPRPVIVPHLHSRDREPQKPWLVSAKYYLFVANKDEVFKHKTSKYYFDKFHLGQKVTITR